jgi:expansin (peptidoglycan-binding protein)
MKTKIFALLSIFGLILSGTGDISAFDNFPEAQDIIEQYTQHYSSKFTKIFKDGPIYTGEATSYGSLTSGGNCLFPKEEFYNDMMYAAINQQQYMDDLGCGLCALVVSTSNPYKAIRVRVLDRCPECAHGDLDLSDKAFKDLTDEEPTRVQIAWAPIPCDIDIPDYPALVEPDSPIKFQFKIGSSQWWFQVQIFNTRYPVATVEMKVDGNYIELSREEHNYWAKPSANVGAGPYTFRVTLADNTVIEAENVTMAVPDDDEGDTFSTGSQVVTQG